MLLQYSLMNDNFRKSQTLIFLKEILSLHFPLTNLLIWLLEQLKILLLLYFILQNFNKGLHETGCNDINIFTLFVTEIIQLFSQHVQRPTSVASIFE